MQKRALNTTARISVLCRRRIIMTMRVRHFTSEPMITRSLTGIIPTLKATPCPTTQNLLLHFVRNWLIMAGSAPKSGRCRSRLTPKAPSRMFPWSAMNGNMKNGAMRKTTMSARVNTTTFPLSSLTTARISTWTGIAAGLHMSAAPAQAKCSTIPLNPVP